MNKSFSVGECFSVGWARFKEHAWFLVGMTLGIYILMLLFDYVIENIYNGIEPTSLFLDILSNVVFYWLYFGMTVVILKIIDRKPYSVSDLFVFDKQVLLCIVGAILYGIMLGIGFLPLILYGIMIGIGFLPLIEYGIMLGIGFFPLIVPGIYLALRYGFFWYAIVDGRKGIVESFKESARITDGVKWNLLLFVFACIGVMILGALCLGVGMLVAVPVVMLATAHLYRVLLAQSTVEPVVPSVSATPERVEGAPVTTSPSAEIPTTPTPVAEKKEGEVSPAA